MALLLASMAGCQPATDSPAAPASDGAAAETSAPPATTPPAGDGAAASEADPAALADQLHREIEALRAKDLPNAVDRQAIIDFALATYGEVHQKADRLLKVGAGRHEEYAILAKLEALDILARVGSDDAAAQLVAAAEEYRDDPRTQIAADANYYSLTARMMELDPRDSAAVRQLAEDIVAHINQTEELGQRELMLAAALGQMLEYSDDPAAAMAAYRDLAKRFESADNPALRAAAEEFRGSARRLALIGDSLELEGTLVDGTPFDWSKYRGKVVLVDFWATWCGPCIDELPNVVANYERFHDRGFEVVGISLDSDRADLEAFIERESTPWPVLFDEGPETSGWQHPMATRYGIKAIPAAILVDQQGVVRTLNARGSELERWLSELLGDGEKPAS